MVRSICGAKTRSRQRMLRLSRLLCVALVAALSSCAKEKDARQTIFLNAYNIGHKKGHEEGYEMGYEMGYSDAMDEYDVEDDCFCETSRIMRPINQACRLRQ